MDDLRLEAVHAAGEPHDAFALNFVKLSYDYKPQKADGSANSNGIVEILAGTGGANPYKIEEVQPNSQKRITNTYGVVKLDFTDTGFSWKLIGTDGSTKDTSPSYSCR